MRPLRKPNRAKSSRTKHARYRPLVDHLEGRALMSYGGTVDLSFATTAVGNLSVGTVGDSIEATSEAVQSNGKVVVATRLTQKIGSAPVAGTAFFALTRLNTNGTVDTTFGGSGSTGGNGRVLLFPTTSFTATTEALAVAIQSDGKIVAAGFVAGNAEVVRLNADGSLDTTFGTNGSVSFSFDKLATSEADHIAIQADGKIVVGGFGEDTAQTPAPVTPAVARFNADGSVDTTFGTGGQVVVTVPRIPSTQSTNTLPGVAGLAIQADGKIVVAATSTSLGAGSILVGQAVVQRLAVNGTLDPTFGTGGVVTLPAQFSNQAATSETATTVLIQPDGKLVVAGTATVPSGASTTAVPFAARLNADGSLDTTYGNGSGVFVGDPSRESLPTNLDLPVGATLQADGKLVLAAGGASTTQADFLRLTTTGALDPSFGEAGLARLAGVSYDATFGPITLTTQADGKILAALTNFVVRLLPSGASGDFNNDGIADPAVYLTPFAAFAYRPSGGAADVIAPFGIAGVGQTLPAPGAYDGNGITELAVYLPSLGAFGVRPYPGSEPATSGADVITPFGIPGAGQSIPVPGDYDGSGRTELAVYLPSFGAFAYRPAGTTGGSDVIVPFGIPGAGQTIPAPGDYFGTGQTDIAAYIPSAGAFAIRNPTTKVDTIIPFGVPGVGQSIPMPGDYDGSGKTELAVYLPSYGIFAFRPANGGSDVIVQFGVPGTGQTLPAPGDYDGSGHTELGVYIPSFGVFAYRPGIPGSPATPAKPDVLNLFGIPGSGQTIPFTAIPEPATPPSPTVAAASVPIPLVTTTTPAEVAITPTTTKKKK